MTTLSPTRRIQTRSSRNTLNIPAVPPSTIEDNMDDELPARKRRRLNNSASMDIVDTVSVTPVSVTPLSSSSKPNIPKPNISKPNKPLMRQTLRRQRLRPQPQMNPISEPSSESDSETVQTSSTSEWHTTDDQSDMSSESVSSENADSITITSDDTLNISSRQSRDMLIKSLIALLVLELQSSHDMDICDNSEDESEDDDTTGSEEDESETEEDESVEYDRKHRNRAYTSLKKKQVDEFCALMKYKKSNECVQYFQALPAEERFAYLQTLAPLQTTLTHSKPLLLMLLDKTNCPENNKLVAIDKLNAIQRMTKDSNGSAGEEIAKIQSWVHNFIRIPFGQYKSIPVTLDSTPSDQREFIWNARRILDDVVYGLDDAKSQIIRLVGQILVNPKAGNTSIGIEGPAGTGKTTLIKEGLGRIFGRPTKFIALGGAVEGSMLEGSPSVYIGSKSGAIVNTLIQEQCMNPIFVFDELDKLTDSSKGYEVSQVIMRLTDTTQNNTFSDKYFEDVELDLSLCTCVFSYNVESKIDPILLSRLYKIKTDGYTYKDKLVIGTKYLLPKILEQMKFAPDDIRFEPCAIRHILDHHAKAEKGVRNLKHCMEMICSKINIARILAPCSSTDEPYSINPSTLTFPFIITADVVRTIIPPSAHHVSEMMYI